MLNPLEVSVTVILLESHVVPSTFIEALSRKMAIRFKSASLSVVIVKTSVISVVLPSPTYSMVQFTLFEFATG